MTEGVKPPVWYWIVAGAFMLWELMGCFAFYAYAIVGPDDPYQRQLGEQMPFWYDWLFALAIVAGTASALLLLARKRLAKPLALVSLIAVVVQYGYVLSTTDLIAHQGLASATGLPAAIVILAAVMLWFAGLAERRGWIS